MPLWTAQKSSAIYIPVSYTHLDVYKRQELKQLEYQKQTDEKLEQIYVILDDPDVRYLAKHDPALLKSVGAEFSAGYVRMKKYPLHFRLR